MLASVRACVDQVPQAAGPIDVLVNNAGAVHEGPLEELPMEDLQAIFETNFFGAVRMTTAVAAGHAHRAAPAASST